MIKPGKLYITRFTEIKVELRENSPNQGTSLYTDRYFLRGECVKPNDIFVVLDYEPLKDKFYTGPRIALDEQSFAIKVLVNEKVGYVLLRECEVVEVE